MISFIKHFAILLTAGVLSFAAGAESIAKITFEQHGSRPLSEDQLFYNIRLRPGMEYSREILDEDIKRLYNTGSFTDVSGRSLPNEDGSVNLQFDLQLQPQVRKVSLEGNAKFKTDDLREKITLAESAPLNNARLRDSARNLREFYRSEGYNEATVTPRIVSVDADTLDITFVIKENLRHRVNRVTFDGASAVPEDVLENAVANRYSFWGSIPLLRDYNNAGLYDSAEMPVDRARVLECYHNAGYLDCRITAVDVTPDEEDPEYLNITYHLEEGEPYTVSAVTFSGNSAVEDKAIAPRIRLKEKETFCLTDQNDTVRAIAAHYETLGHADVDVRPVQTADPEHHTVAVDFRITEGRRYTVRAINISGNTYTKDKVIRRELAIQPGDPVDRNRLEVSKSRLMGMGYFSKVEIPAVNADRLDEKDVEVKVEEKHERFNIKVGAGVSDINNLVGMAQISSNNFDLLNPGDWFYGGGQRFRAQGLIGVDRMGGNIDFTEPWLFDIPLRFDTGLYWDENEYEYWDERRIGVRVGLTHKIFDDFTTISGNYKFENVNVRHMSHKLGPETREESGKEWVSQVAVVLDRDTRDSLTNPTSGYNINVLAAVSPKLMGSTTDFMRFETRGSFYYSFFNKAIITMAGLRLGTVTGFDTDDRVPIFERYFLGGGDTIRGFPYRSVGPLDSRNRPTGGQTMMVGTVEISHPIWRWIRGAVFVDVGNAWEDACKFGPGGINVGAGYGLRLMIPVLNAPIKLDFAYPIVNDQDNESSKLRFHFNMGFTVY